jgi:hypothetical protein
MASLSDLLSWMDNKRRVAGRNVADLAQNPSDYLSMTAANTPQTIREYGEDPMNFVGGGVGRVKGLNKNTGKMDETYPTQAALAGQAHSMGLVNPQQAQTIYGLRGEGGKAVDPELLDLIEKELFRRRPLNDLMDVRTD